MVAQFDVYVVALDPTVGAEMQKTCPCVIITPDSMNRHMRTVIIAPLTGKGHDFPSRVALTFQGKKGQIALDQIRTVDKARLKKKLGSVNQPTAQTICDRLVEMFEY